MLAAVEDSLKKAMGRLNHQRREKGFNGMRQPVTFRKAENGLPATQLPTNFQLLFESLPELYLILSPSLHIVAANKAYLEATMTTREAILHRPLFEVFPDNPDEPEATGPSNLRDSLERVLRSRRSDTSVAKYSAAV